MSKEHEQDDKPQTITVAGVTFSAEAVVSATLKIDGRKVVIQETEDEVKKIGFHAQ